MSGAGRVPKVPKVETKKFFVQWQYIELFFSCSVFSEKCEVMLPCVLRCSTELFLV